MRVPPAALAFSALLPGCAASDAPEAPPPEAAAVIRASVPPHWIGTFTMVAVDGRPAGPDQFQLRLGLEGPDHFRAQRGCYTQQGSLAPQGSAWIVRRRGDIQVDRQCLARAGTAAGSPDGLFEHRTIILSPPGEGYWIAEGGRRWTYLPNPRAPIPPPPPPPPAPPSRAGMPGGGLQGADPDAVEALYRHQMGDGVPRSRERDVTLCLGAGPDNGHLADPPQTLLDRFSDHRPPVKGYSKCLWNRDRWIDPANGRNAIVHYIVRFHCPSPTRCSAGGGYLQGNLSSSGNSYELERRSGRWQVTSDVTEWIS